MYFSELLASKHNRIRLSCAQNIEDLLGDIGDEVAHTINANYASSDLLLGCLYLTIDHFFKCWHWFTKVSDADSASQFYCSMCKYITFWKSSANGINRVQLHQL